MSDKQEIGGETLSTLVQHVEVNSTEVEEIVEILQESLSSIQKLSAENKSQDGFIKPLLNVMMTVRLVGWRSYKPEETEKTGYSSVPVIPFRN